MLLRAGHGIVLLRIQHLHRHPDGVPGRCLVPEHLDAEALGRALAAVVAAAPGTVVLSPRGEVEGTIALAKQKGAKAVLVLENGTERRVEL